MNKDELKAILPQREPFLFLDKVTEISGTEKVVAERYLSPDEPFFKGHFPGKPVMPGVLTTEAMAQACIVLYSLCKPEIAAKHPDYYLGKVNVEFLAPAFPGDTLIIEARKVKIMASAAVMEASVRVGERTVAKANLVFGVKQDEQK